MGDGKHNSVLFSSEGKKMEPSGASLGDIKNILINFKVSNMVCVFSILLLLWKMFTSCVSILLKIIPDLYINRKQFPEEGSYY